MWYKKAFTEENVRTAKPWHLPVNKHHKKKIKHFDGPMDEEFQTSFETPMNDVMPKMPANVIESPDLPAGVDVPPSIPILDKKKEPAHNSIHKPKELEDLYGPDKNINDDQIINKPPKMPRLEDDLNQIQDEEKHIELPLEEIENEENLEPPLDESEEEIPISPEQTNQPVPDPPIHNLCHCKIITMPGGRRIWRASNEACNDCLQARDTFNQWQATLFGA